MSHLKITRPDATEHAPYYGKYVALVPEGDIIATLGEQLDDTLVLVRSISEEKAETRYAPGKWSIKEVIGHLIDSERVFAYRALRFSRNDQTELPGFDENDYVRNAAFGECRLANLATEFEYLRRANLHFFRHLSQEAWLQRGKANGNEVTVRALAYIIAGHERHHREILRTRYL